MRAQMYCPKMYYSLLNNNNSLFRGHALLMEFQDLKISLSGLTPNILLQLVDQLENTHL